MAEERNACLASMLQAGGVWPLHSRRVLDVGCGGGDLLGFFETLGVQREHLFGVDLMRERIETARDRLPGANLSIANGEDLAFPAASFDVVSLFVVFSSILSDTMALNLARETTRVLRRDGVVIVYDFRLPSIGNRSTRPVSRAYVRRLFPRFSMTARSLTLLPPIARSLGGATRLLYPALASLPFMRTHNLMLIRPVTQAG